MQVERSLLNPVVPHSSLIYGLIQVHSVLGRRVAGWWLLAKPASCAARDCSGPSLSQTVPKLTQ